MEAFRPFGEAIDIRENNHLPPLQDQEPVIDQGLAAGGQPEKNTYVESSVIKPLLILSGGKNTILWTCSCLENKH